MFNQYPTLKKSDSSSSLAESIENKLRELSSYVIEKFTSLYNKYDPKKLYLPCIALTDSNKNNANELAYGLKYYDNKNILSKIMDLEYKTRTQNKALLLRGASFEEFQVGIGKKPKKAILAGTTLKRRAKELLLEGEFEQTYIHKENQPYSISFGNSLFAGFLRDESASTYYFLSSRRVENSSDKKPPTSAYALFIDKKAYKQHQNNNLFFISPLASLTALFQRGEYFHSRTKAAVISKKKKEVQVSGIYGRSIKDQTGVILITRDPLRHAELFSNFLAENGHIIQQGNVGDLSDKEREFIANIKPAQKEAAQFYKAFRTITPHLQRAMESYKKHKTKKEAPYFTHASVKQTTKE